MLSVNVQNCCLYIFIIKSYTEYKHKKEIKEITEEKKLVACNIHNNTVNLLQAKPRRGER